jgi:hypothetical protein
MKHLRMFENFKNSSEFEDYIKQHLYDIIDDDYVNIRTSTYELMKNDKLFSTNLRIEIPCKSWSRTSDDLNDSIKDLEKVSEIMKNAVILLNSFKNDPNIILIDFRLIPNGHNDTIEISIQVIENI